jgi:hypothetical protein
MTAENNILKFIEESTWTYAKSMPFLPHWYIVRDRVDNKKFVEFVLYIRKYGVDRPFGKKRMFRYLDIGEFTYWTMGNPLIETTIINRARIKKR